MRKVLFLDRDGVINDNSTHVNKPEDLIIYDEAKKGLKLAYEAGYELFIVTNQGGIELGHISKDDLNNIHKKLKDDLNDYCKIKDIEYCPDFRKRSKYRKPQPGMIIKLSNKYNIDLTNAWMIGDMDTDIIAGIKAGCKTAKIGKPNKQANINGKDLLDVIEKILKID